LTPRAHALDEDHYKLAQSTIDRAIEYLRTQQDEETGGWSVPERGPTLPAITGLVVNGMIMDPRIDETDPAIARGVEYILSFRKEDGGIYDRILPSYNTSICLSALSRVRTPEAVAAIRPAQDFLRSTQWSEDMAPDVEQEAGGVEAGVGPEHPFYGGVGYGRHGRPDLSNLHFMIQALHDSGLSCDDPAFQRALVFLERTQMHEDVNDMPYARGSRQGGFIYATSPDRESLGVGQSMAGEFEETLADGTTATRLRAYGSMTYAGFKSYIYAQLDRDDPRVQHAYDWIRRNYRLQENPGMGAQGLYYYYVTFSRAMEAWGLPTIETLTPEGSIHETRFWANDLIAQLAKLQQEDGSFQNLHDRWMEGDDVLVTAYALLALQHAIR